MPSNLESLIYNNKIVEVANKNIRCHSHKMLSMTLSFKKVNFTFEIYLLLKDFHLQIKIDRCHTFVNFFKKPKSPS